MDLLLFQVAASAAEGELTAQVQRLLPSSPQQPSGRSHHTACYHPSGRCLLVFGGYSSGGGGCLGELWVWRQDSLDWWRPEPIGA
ncbi:dnaJ_C domain-containing protein [Haematococcus lacustris]|uniref:DnaJ_C domain-containing protein n=1 Tax=Haematococcus lacustris TaxID=44745 RepID=A0A699ZT20_HAELA|nr:dnaJ_C domain-containing protein [Haematococcus lacustris]